MKVEVEGVYGCWVEHRKKRGQYRIAFRDAAANACGRLIVVTFYTCPNSHNHYMASIDLGNVSCDGAFFPGDDRYPDPNFYLDKAIGVMKGIVPSFPTVALAVTP